MSVCLVGNVLNDMHAKLSRKPSLCDAKLSPPVSTWSLWTSARPRLRSSRCLVDFALPSAAQRTKLVESSGGRLIGVLFLVYLVV